MPYRQTYNPPRLIRYLQDRLYSQLPAVLYDRYLWFYADLEKVQYQLVYGPFDPSVRLYENMSTGPDPVGIALVENNGNQMRVLINADNSLDLGDFIQRIKVENHRTNAAIIVPEEKLAAFLVDILGWDLIPGAVKLYADQKTLLTSAEVREMFAPDERYLEALQPRRWPAYEHMLSLGYRFFGRFSSEDDLVSMCGLVPLTAFRSEIIGVETFAPQDRQKGFAHSVCALALNEGLESSPVVTWSTHLNNAASLQTARSLGFRQIYSLYSLIGRF